MAETLYASDVFTMEVASGVLRARLNTTPSSDAVSDIVTRTIAYLRRCPQKVALHIQHVESECLEPPDLGFLLRLTADLFQHRDVVEQKVSGTCIQATKLDEPAKMARDLFFTFYRPDNFKIVVGDDKAQAFLAKVQRETNHPP